MLGKGHMSYTITQKTPFLDYNKTKNEKSGTLWGETLWGHGLYNY